METFTWKLELELAGVGSGWIDCTTDVSLMDGNIEVTDGMQSTSLIDLLANPGSISFVLDNSLANSAHLAGYYSPGHTNCRTGFAKNIRVRYSEYYNSTRYYQGIYWLKKPIPAAGLFGEQITRCRATDWLEVMMNVPLPAVGVQTSQTGDQLLTTLLALVTSQPQSTDFDTGDSTYASSFDTDDVDKDSVYSVLGKIARSGYERIYLLPSSGTGDGVELLTNGGLETWSSPTQPTGWYCFALGYTFQETTEKYSGNYSIKTYSAADTPFYYTPAILTAGKTYKISGWSKGATGAARFYITDTAWNAKYNHNFTSDGYYEEFYTADGSEIYGYMAGEMGQTIYFDALSIQEVIGGGVLKFEHRNARLANVTNLGTISNEMDDAVVIDDAGQVFDRFRVQITPRRVDTSLVTVATLNYHMYLNPGEERPFTLNYVEQVSGNRISGTNIQVPAAGTDYKFGSIDDGTTQDLNANLAVTQVRTGGNSSDLKAKNNGAVGGYLNLLQLRGYGIYSFNQYTVEVGTGGLRVQTLDMPYQNNPLTADAVCNYLQSISSNNALRGCRVSFHANKSAALMTDAMTGLISTRWTIVETQTALNGDYFINGRKRTVSLGNRLDVEWLMVPASGAGAWVLGTSALGVDTVLTV